MHKGTGNALLAAEKRVAADLEAQLKKRSTHESRVAAAARALSAVSATIRSQLAQVAKELARKGQFERELFGVALRVLAEQGDKRLGAVINLGLKTEDFGGLGTLAPACFTRDAGQVAYFVKAAQSGKTHIAFAAEVARACRGELTGPRLHALAPRIKEAYRISLCTELFLPLVLEDKRISREACAAMANALHVLCGSERHLGRWLLMAMLAHRGGDPRPLAEARERTQTGPDSSRAAWSLVAWALCPEDGCTTRPTSELVARLSHRPSADRDPAFLFRMAEDGLDVARPMLEAMARTRPLGDDVALRSAYLLAKRYDREGFFDEVAASAERRDRDDLRGLAAAAFWDLGEAGRAVQLAEELAQSSDLTAVTWAGLVHAVASAPSSKQPACVLTEENFRRVQRGWSE